MTTNPMTKRIEDFISVAKQRYANNPRKWERMYNQLYELLPTVEAERLEAEWVLIANKEALEDWDTAFLEATIAGDEQEDVDDDTNRYGFGWAGGNLGGQGLYNPQLGAQSQAAQAQMQLAQHAQALAQAQYQKQQYDLLNYTEPSAKRQGLLAKLWGRE